MFRLRLQPIPCTIVICGIFHGQRSTLGNCSWGLWPGNGFFKIESLTSTNAGPSQKKRTTPLIVLDYESPIQYAELPLGSSPSGFSCPELAISFCLEAHPFGPDPFGPSSSSFFQWSPLWMSPGRESGDIETEIKIRLVVWGWEKISPPLHGLQEQKPQVLENIYVSFCFYNIYTDYTQYLLTMWTRQLACLKLFQRGSSNDSGEGGCWIHNALCCLKACCHKSEERAFDGVSQGNGMVALRSTIVSSWNMLEQSSARTQEIPSLMGCRTFRQHFLVRSLQSLRRSLWPGLMKIESGSSIELSKLHCFTKQDQSFDTAGLHCVNSIVFCRFSSRLYSSSWPRHRPTASQISLGLKNRLNGYSWCSQQRPFSSQRFVQSNFPKMLGHRRLAVFF